MDSYSYQPSLGSLTGFDRVDLVNGTANDLVKLGWSVEQIRAFLLNESDINFPSEDWVRQVDDLINDHINDTNNPHKVTIDQITPSFTRDVLGAITNGTPPRVPPFFAYDTACAIPLNDIFPANFGSSNLYRFTEGGVFTIADNEVNEMGVDCTVGKGGVPLFGPIFNTIALDWATRESAPISTNITPTDVLLGNFPFPSYVVTEASPYADFGIAIAAPRTVGQSYTFTAFIQPTIVGGSLVISQVNSADGFMTVDLATGKVVVTGSNVRGEAFLYPSGIVKVAFAFIATSSSDVNAVQLIHKENGATTNTTHDGSERALFSISNALVTQSFVNHPSLVNTRDYASSTPFDIQLARIPAAPTLSDVMVVMAINMYPSLPNQADNDTTILSFDSLRIERSDTTMIVRYKEDVLHQEPILPGLNILAVSYSPTKIVFKSGGGPRHTVDGAFESLATQRVSVGPCGGYLQAMAMYGDSDNSLNLEYLTNG